MKQFRYLSNVTTLSFDENKCSGCGVCETVCPHGVFVRNNGTMRIMDRDGCMECGACATNCPTGAVRVDPGVGCAEYIIKSWFKGKSGAVCC